MTRDLPPGIKAMSEERTTRTGKTRYELVVIGCSMGGMHALMEILDKLPADFPAPVAIVQHRYRTSNEVLPALLQRHTPLEVVDAADKQFIRTGTVYLAPANYHLLVDRGMFHLSTEAAVAYSRPSIDVLFESAADVYGGRTVGVILTGANADGARGAAKIKQHGGFVVVQDPQSAEAPEMPQAAIDTARVDRILPLERIGPFLVELCRTAP